MSPIPENNSNQQQRLMEIFRESEDGVPLMYGLPHTEASIVRGDENIELPKLHVMNQYHFDIYGVDAIWHNVYAGDEKVWGGFRKSYDASIDQLLQMVARHVAKGYYSIVSLNASRHNLTVVCAGTQVLDLGSEDWNDIGDNRLESEKQ